MADRQDARNGPVGIVHGRGPPGNLPLAVVWARYRVSHAFENRVAQRVAKRFGTKLLTHVRRQKYLGPQSAANVGQPYPCKLLHKPVKPKNAAILVEHEHDRLGRIDDAIGEFPLFAQRLGRLLAIGDIANDAGKGPPARLLDFTDGQIDREQRAVLPSADHFPADADNLLDSRLEVIGDVTVVLLGVRLGHQHRDVLSQQLGLAVAKDSLGRRVDRFNDAVIVDANDGVDRGL